MSLRLGDLLVKRGVLSESQRQSIVGRQRSQSRPFGVLAEEMFGVSPSQVEQAWAEQYAGIASTVDPTSEVVDPEVLALVDRRQAWQFRILPMRFSGEELLMCTTQSDLPRALRFAGWRLMHMCHFVLADPQRLSEALRRHYPAQGMESLIESEAAPAT